METEPTPTDPAAPPALLVTSEERADPTTAAAEEVVDLMPLRVKINPAAPDEMFTVQVRPPHRWLTLCLRGSRINPDHLKSICYAFAHPRRDGCHTYVYV